MKKTRWLNCAILIAVAAMMSNAGQLSRSSVDAVTAATVNNSCKFNYPILATDTSAVITWTEAKDGGTAKFCFGTVNPPANCRAVLATERAASTISLEGLSPSTTYYIYVEMTKPGETQYAASGSFATNAKASAANPVAPSTDRPSTIVGNRLITGSAVHSGDRIVQTDLSGRVVFSRTLRDGEREVSVPSAGRAMYIVTIMRERSVIKSFKVMTGTGSF